MRKILSIITIIGALMMSSCSKWLDVNENPNTPNTKVPTVELRLPSIIARFAEAYESGGTRAALISQQIAGTTANNWNLSRWNISTAAINWPFQPWYIYTAVNIPDLIEAGEKVNANHYIGVGKIIWAWGFSSFSDLYGIMPYDEAFVGGNMTPKYDQGELIFNKCLTILDEGIAYLEKEQGGSAPNLSKGDYLYGGDRVKWIKLAYGLKARMLNHLSKTELYKPDEILALLEKAPKTVGESALYQYKSQSESGNTTTESLQYQNNSSNRVTKLYIDYLLNNYTGAPKGINDFEDPRADILVPRILPDNSRTPGVDMQLIAADGFASKLNNYAGLRPSTLSTGVYYAKPDSKGLLLTSSEMNFIKAEVYFVKGDKVNALKSYKEGIKAHMDILGVSETASQAFLNSTSVVQDADKLTLSQVMIQKYISLSYSPEVFNDLRRLDYCTDASGKYNEANGIYKGLQRPKSIFDLAFPSEDMWPRRFAVASYGINFNFSKVIEADPDAQSAIYTAKRVWWDVKK